MGGHDDNRQLRRALAQARQQFQPVGARHPNIRHHRVGPVSLERIQHARRAFERRDRHAVALERLFQHPTDGVVVVDDPNVLFSAHPVFPKGSNSVKTVSPGRLAHSIRPPCWLTIFWAIDKPNPVPSGRPLIIG